MRDEELEGKLKEARREAEEFFAGWSFDPLREVVHCRVKALSPGGLAWKRSPLRTGGLLAAAALILLLAWLPVRLKGGRPNALPPDFPGLDGPVAQYAINLREGAEQWLSFFRLPRPDWKENQLLAVIWERNGSAPEYYRPLYSSVFGGSGNPEPTLTVKLPGSNRPLALIFSRDRDLAYLHYRVVGYDGQQVTSYWQQDFVPGGELEVHSGVVVERRRVPGVMSGGLSLPEPDSVAQVNFLVPYQIDPTGELLLPVERLQMEVGQYLTFIGADDKVQTYVQGAALHWLEAKEGAPAAQFYAAQRGTGIVLLESKGKGTGRRQIAIEVE